MNTNKTKCIPSHHPQSHLPAHCTVCGEPVPWAAGELPGLMPVCKGEGFKDGAARAAYAAWEDVSEAGSKIYERCSWNLLDDNEQEAWRAAVKAAREWTP